MNNFNGKNGKYVGRIGYVLGLLACFAFLNMGVHDNEDTVGGVLAALVALIGFTLYVFFG